MKAVLVTFDDQRIDVDVPGDAGVVIRQDTRCKTPVRAFCFGAGLQLAGSKPFFHEVKVHYLDPHGGTPEALNDWADPYIPG